MPRVSVLMTVYNAAPYVRASVDSVLAQAFPDWELVAVDDGSTDASPSILADYVDPRVRVIPFPKNIGRTPALRHALHAARGEYIAVLDADDMSRPERLGRQVAFLDRNPEVALVGSWAHYIDEHARIFAEFKPPSNREELQDCLGWTNPIVHSSAMYRRQLALQVGGYPEELAYAIDLGLILALAPHSQVAMIDEFLCQKRVLSTSLTRSSAYRVAIVREQLVNFQRAAALLPLSQSARRLNRRAQAITEIKLGIATVRTASSLAGVNLVARGLVRDPSALWTNGPVRRFFGANPCFLENALPDTFAIRARR